jgi:ABC-type uncharacterized transport system substrate-binding protein
VEPVHCARVRGAHLSCEPLDGPSGSARTEVWPSGGGRIQTGRIRSRAAPASAQSRCPYSVRFDGLRESGFIEGKNIIIERRFAQGSADRYAELVAELVRLNVDVDFPYAQAEWQRLEFAARSLNVNLRQLVVRRASEFEGAFTAIARERPDVLLVTTSPLNFSYRRRIIDLATKSRLPTMSPFREYPEAGGLMSYGNVRVDRFRSAAIFVGKILKGAKPADLPLEQPTKYELVINLNTARSFNLEIPRDLLLVADEVIE